MDNAESNIAVSNNTLAYEDSVEMKRSGNAEVESSSVIESVQDFEESMQNTRSSGSGANPQNDLGSEASAKGNERIFTMQEADETDETDETDNCKYDYGTADTFVAKFNMDYNTSIMITSQSARDDLLQLKTIAKENEVELTELTEMNTAVTQFADSGTEVVKFSFSAKNEIYDKFVNQLKDKYKDKISLTDNYEEKQKQLENEIYWVDEEKSETQGLDNLNDELRNLIEIRNNTPAPDSYKTGEILIMH